jgi:hypothetical protein
MSQGKKLNTAWFEEIQKHKRLNHSPGFVIVMAYFALLMLASYIINSIFLT